MLYAKKKVLKLLPVRRYLLEKVFSAMVTQQSSFATTTKQCFVYFLKQIVILDIFLDNFFFQVPYM